MLEYVVAPVEQDAAVAAAAYRFVGRSVAGFPVRPLSGCENSWRGSG